MKTVRKLLIAFVIVIFAGIVVPNIVPVLNSTISVEAASIKISATKKTLYEKKTCTLKVIGTKKKVKWSSSKKSVAQVNSKGKVIAKKKGTAIITAKVGNKKYKCKITVKPAEITKRSVTLYKGNSYTLKVLGATSKIKWYTSNKSVVTVSSKGKITAKKKGTATITAKMGNKKYKCKVTVKNPYIKKAKLSFYPYEEYALCVYGRKNVKWTSSNRKVVTVTSNGRIKAQSAGTAKITATYGKEKYICEVIVNSYIENEENVKIGTELLRHTIYIDDKAELGDWESLKNWPGYRKILNYKKDFEEKYTKNFIKNYWYTQDDRIYIENISGQRYLHYPCRGGIEGYIDEELKTKKITDDTIVFNSIGYYFEDMEDSDKYINTGNIRESLEECNIKYYTMTSEFVIKKEDGAWKVDKYRSLRD